MGNRIDLRLRPPKHSLSVALALCGLLGLQSAFAQTTPISEIQGAGVASPLDGQLVTVHGVVTGDFQERDELGGFFVQELLGDGLDATSEGIFVYHGSTPVEVGDLVEVSGVVEEHHGLTELTDVVSVSVLDESELPPPAQVVLPLPEGQEWEQYEGMLLEVSSADRELIVTETFHLGRGGLVMLADERLIQYTETRPPSVEGFRESQRALERETLLLDDGSLEQNPDPVRFATSGPELTAADTLRLGDSVATVTGVLSYSFSGWSGTDAFRLHATEPVDFESANPRPEAAPEVGGSIRVASFNVLNLFNGNGEGGGFPTPRGADTPAELERQLDKLVAAMLALDAHVLGLIEIENDDAGVGSAVASLVQELNQASGEQTYDYIETGRIGDDEIKQAIIYQPGAVEPLGDYRVLGGEGQGAQHYQDERFDGSLNRPALAQTFATVSDGESFTVIVNHLKSKGQHCAHVADYDTGDGQGNCNGVRTRAALALADWADALATEVGDPDVLIMGDLNAYSMEDPIVALRDAGFVDLLPEEAYSYVFFGAAGTLDHALATPSLARQVTGARIWHINADEPAVLDYNSNYKSSRHVDLLYDDSPFRSSDHDPVLVGLELGTTETSATGPLTSRELLVDDVRRSYALSVPEPGPLEPAPLIVALHGRGGSGEQMATQTDLGGLLGSHGVLVAYPDGLDGQWNYLTGLGGNNEVNDLAFLESLVQDVARDWPVDRERIYLVGYSNGGFMAQRAACEPDTPFAGFASVAAAGFGGLPELCNRGRPLSMLLIHGTADAIVPWDGQVAGLAGRELLLSASVPETLAFWAGFAGCGGQSSRRSVEPADDSPETQVEILTVTDCPAGQRVALYAVVNGGHNWPGRPTGGATEGFVNRDIDAGRVIWEFLETTSAGDN